MELSAREDPEAVQIEAVKQITLGSCPLQNTLAEVISYRYWSYNALSYDDKILDGFYDFYGILDKSIGESMPSLVDLQGKLFSDGVTWEAVFVNRASDSSLLKLEDKALSIATKLRSESLGPVGGELVKRVAALVSDYMGGPVENLGSMFKAWQSFSSHLKESFGSTVFPLGSLTVGLTRHRALLFKILADCVGVPCRIAKGKRNTGSDYVAMSFVKIEDGREYIVDLMGDPGRLIPPDAAGSHIEYDESFSSTSSFSRDVDSSNMASFSSGFNSSLEEHSDLEALDEKSRGRDYDNKEASKVREMKGKKIEEESKISLEEPGNLSNIEKVLVQELPRKPLYSHLHARSPSWTEGASSLSVRKMKVKDVSQYMIDAAKENPQLAQKLHDVLLESGVVAPPSLFTEDSHQEFEVEMLTVKSPTEEEDKTKTRKGTQKSKGLDDQDAPQFLPPLPHHGEVRSKARESVQNGHLKSAEGLKLGHFCELREATGQVSSTSSASETSSVIQTKNVPVAAAAMAAAAAVVASSMVVAAAKANTDPNLELPAAAAAAGKQYEHAKTSGRISDQSTTNNSSKSGVLLNDVADCEIPWEEITLGARIGLGSCGEVYHGEWHGTEVAVKKFLEQDISVELLEEFIKEVRIMKRLRHPNVVLFMGAVTRAPNLSIVTEFLPRGSLYRLIHRPNNQLDERRRLRMALDAARGMNYLHNCTPVIVHRDMKSPNLLVDKNWVLKVSDFGLSRMKHSTFLSSRSTAGTAEWMAPEVLRNEPSDEKCDVYSFGVILWELCTLQQPWGGMNPMQVVGAVGFQHRRLDIPDRMDPAIAEIIRKCWQTDPKLRPTFAEIIAALKPLQKHIASSQRSI